jgi:hypothetical protein
LYGSRKKTLLFKEKQEKPLKVFASRGLTSYSFILTPSLEYSPFSRVDLKGGNPLRVSHPLLNLLEL